MKSCRQRVVFPHDPLSEAETILRRARVQFAERCRHDETHFLAGLIILAACEDVRVARLRHLLHDRDGEDALPRLRLLFACRHDLLRELHQLLCAVMLDVIGLQLVSGTADAFVASSGERAFQKLAPVQGCDFTTTQSAIKQTELIYAAFEADARAFPTDAPRLLGRDGAAQ